MSDLNARVIHVVQQAPAWVRTDLTSWDPATRVRAEETLAAMIAAALHDGAGEASPAAASSAAGSSTD